MHIKELVSDVHSNKRNGHGSAFKSKNRYPACIQIKEYSDVHSYQRALTLT